jgi:hypothetical protein
MARQRVQGSAGGDEPEANEGGEGTTTPKPPEAPVDANAGRGEPSPLGGRKGVRIMFRANQRDDSGALTPPGERTVSAEEATELVKQGIATIL